MIRFANKRLIGSPDRLGRRACFYRTGICPHPMKIRKQIRDRFTRVLHLLQWGI